MFQCNSSVNMSTARNTSFIELSTRKSRTEYHQDDDCVVGDISGGGIGVRHIFVFLGKILKLINWPQESDLYSTWARVSWLRQCLCYASQSECCDRVHGKQHGLHQHQHGTLPVGWGAAGDHSGDVLLRLRPYPSPRRSSGRGSPSDQFLWEILLQIVGGKWLMGVGVLVTAVFTLLTPLAANTNLYLLYAVRVIEGLGEGL